MALAQPEAVDYLRNELVKGAQSKAGRQEAAIPASRLPEFTGRQKVRAGPHPLPEGCCRDASSSAKQPAEYLHVVFEEHGDRADLMTGPRITGASICRERSPG